MDKKILNRLKKKCTGIHRKWTKEEIETLKELKQNNIPPSIFMNDEDLMKDFFPNRSVAALKAKYALTKI